MKISFIIPSRNNLKYLQQAVQSITDCYGEEHDIVLLDDASTDGTWEWIESLQGDHFIKYRNAGPERVGHTILYDTGVELSRTEIFSILHADMVTTKNHVANSLKHMKPGVVVAATRIEPPLHPPGPEKYVRAFGFEPEEFERNAFLQEVEVLEQENANKLTNGIFAPWMMYKSDFENIGGHDPLFAPMELEDSDIFNRMHLAGYELIQSRDAFVYHMTCRGSRFKDGIEIEAEIPLPDGTIWYKPKDSEEYKTLRAIKFREWPTWESLRISQTITQTDAPTSCDASSRMPPMKRMERFLLKLFSIRGQVGKRHHLIPTHFKLLSKLVTE